MNLSEMQAELRHFAAERDWQPFHTPKNLSTALMVQAAELAEVFQWMTPQESQLAHQDPATKQRIGDEVADVLLYLLQVADHSEIDIAHAVRDKLARNALKYPARRTVAKISTTSASLPGTHVLLDYENVQPTADELRALVPDVDNLWVFHGPHQRHVEQRFASFGANVTAVPISKTGRNALDFHLAFYMGYIVSRKAESAIVVVANDKGYEPMLEHAKAMGFAVRQQGHGRVTSVAAVKPKPAAKVTGTGKPAAKKAVAKKPAVKQPAAKKLPAKQASAKVAAVSAPAAKGATAKKSPLAKQASPKSTGGAAANKVVVVTPNVAAKATAPAGNGSAVIRPSTDVAATIKKLTESLRKMGDQRPTKPASLRRSLKSFLGVETTEEAVQRVLIRLIEDGVVKVDATKGASYPMFGS